MDPSLPLQLPDDKYAPGGAYGFDQETRSRIRQRVQCDVSLTNRTGTGIEQVGAAHRADAGRRAGTQ